MNSIDNFQGSNNFEVSKKNVIQILKDVRDIIFPGYFNSLSSNASNAKIFLKERIQNSLVNEIRLDPTTGSSCWHATNNANNGSKNNNFFIIGIFKVIQ